MSKTNKTLSEPEILLMRWFVETGAMQQGKQINRKGDSLTKLIRKGFIEQTATKTYALTEAGKEWLFSDEESRAIAERRKCAEQKRDDLLRQWLGQLESMLADDADFAALFSKSGLVSGTSSSKMRTDPFTDHEMQDVVQQIADHLVQMQKRITEERSEIALQAELAAQRREVEEKDCVDWEAAAKLLRLSEAEFRKAFELKFVSAARFRWQEYGENDYFRRGYYERSALVLTDKQRDQLHQQTTLNRWQAAERLGIKPEQFDKLRRGRIEHVDVYYTASGFRGFLYRQTDVDGLRDFLWVITDKAPKHRNRSK